MSGRHRILAVALACALARGEALGDDVTGDLERLDRGLYEMTGAVAPRDPVTGRPLVNVVPEDLEIRLARDFFRKYAEEARARGEAVDPRGERLRRLRRVFSDLVAVAHRRNLPWEVHLVDDSTPNAFTAGGGLVVVLGGLFTAGLLRDDDDEAIAVVLAHEIAHVALLHPPARVTWLRVGGVVAPRTQDPYYRAAYTEEQEAEADRLSVLYLALAGFDPLCASRLWARVAAERQDSAARAGYRNDHPVGAERVAITRDAGEQAARYFIAGRRNPHHDRILADNVLYPAHDDAGYRPGEGVTRAGAALLEGFRVHQRAAREGEERRAAAAEQASVRVIGTWNGTTREGDPGLVVDVWNGAPRPVAGIALSLAYWSAGDMVMIEDCRAEVRIAPRETGTLTCPRQGLDADRIEPRVTEVSWR